MISFVRSAASPTLPSVMGRRCTPKQYGAAASIGWKGPCRGCRCSRASSNSILPRSSSAWSSEWVEANWPVVTDFGVCRHRVRQDGNLIPLGYGARPRIWVHHRCSDLYRAELHRQASSRWASKTTCPPALLETTNETATPAARS